MKQSYATVTLGSHNIQGLEPRTTSLRTILQTASVFNTKLYLDILALQETHENSTKRLSMDIIKKYEYIANHTTQAERV